MKVAEMTPTPRVGDLVKMKRGYSAPGILLKIISSGEHLWARILWSDDGPGTEKIRDLEVISECR